MKEKKKIYLGIEMLDQVCRDPIIAKMISNCLAEVEGRFSDIEPLPYEKKIVPLQEWKEYKQQLSAVEQNIERRRNAVISEYVRRGIEAAWSLVQEGTRSFPAFAKVMIEDFGDDAKPYLRQWYEGIRYQPGFDSQGMSSRQEVEDYIASAEFDLL